MRILYVIHSLICIILSLYYISNIEILILLISWLCILGLSNMTFAYYLFFNGEDNRTNSNLHKHKEISDDEVKKLTEGINKIIREELKK